MLSKTKTTELIKEYFPDANEESCEAILWGCTRFPFTINSDMESELRSQVQELVERYGSDPLDVVLMCMEEMDKIFMEHLETHKND